MHAGLEALAAASVLIEAGDADAMVVVAVDEGGALLRALSHPVVDLRAGAVAVLLTARGTTQDGRRARARVGAITLRRGSPPLGTAPAGHRALLPLSAPGFIPEVVGFSPPDAFARIQFDAV
jgi:hypothetical protein